MEPRPDSADFHYRAGRLYCEGVAVEDLAAAHGTPLYVYSRAGMSSRFRLLREAFGEAAHICYAVKANSNLTILREFAALGAGFDIVSGGELHRLQAAGLATDKTVFAGVAKEDWEIRQALAAGILLFNVESAYEVPLLAALASEQGREIGIALRLNVDVDAGTHQYVTTSRRGNKFGLGLDAAAAAVEQIAAAPRLALRGYHVHLGSLLRRVEPYLEAMERVFAFMDGAAVRREGVAYYDCGGGFGISYGDGGGLLDVAALARAMLPALGARGLSPILEPGRFLIADAGILVTRVLGTKQAGSRSIALVDAAMNDLLRPALYDARHPVAPVRQAGAGAGAGAGVGAGVGAGAGTRAEARAEPEAEAAAPGTSWDVVGPVCESADFLAKDRSLPAVDRGDLLAVFATGAYGFSMASNYNSRRRPAEVLVRGEAAQLIRSREDFGELWARELPPAADPRPT